jgi:hypothetical protein
MKRIQGQIHLFLDDLAKHGKWSKGHVYVLVQDDGFLNWVLIGMPQTIQQGRS